MNAIKIEMRKAGTSKNISDAHFCQFEGCYKPAKYKVTFLDHLWETWDLCDKHQKEEKEVLEKVYERFNSEKND